MFSDVLISKQNPHATHDSQPPQCTFVFSPGPGKKVLIFDGRTPGKIVPARGPHEFGWDPVFQVSIVVLVVAAGLVCVSLHSAVGGAKLADQGLARAGLLAVHL